MSNVVHFLVTTPVYNGARYIDETILSIAGQAGPFRITYHVQDGGSTDGTLDKLRRWQDLFDAGFPCVCEGLSFSFASEPDRGLYDAVNKGFRACGPGDVMTWINADDRLEPGAFSTVAQILARFASVRWLCGLGAVIDEAGGMMQMRRLRPHVRFAILKAVYDGRFSKHMIMQEGTFWRAGLWQEAGELDGSFRLAGDYELWHRFARLTDLVVVDSTFGFFRSRAGQLSGDLKIYQAELEARLPAVFTKGRRLAAWRERLGFVSYRRATRRYKQAWKVRTFLALRLFVDHSEIALPVRRDRPVSVPPGDA